MTKRFLSLVMSLTLMLTLTAGCGKSGSEGQSAAAPSGTVNASTPSDQQDPITITVSNWPKETDAGYQIAQSQLEIFKEKYPYITLKTDEWTYDVNSFLPKAASGQLPTVYTTWFTEIQKILDAGYSADITDVMKKYNLDKDLNPDMLALVKRDGKYYGLPSSGYVMGMWYNVNLFREAGLLDEKGVPLFPKTYDELAETAKIIKDRTGKAGLYFPGKNNQAGWYFMNIAWAFGAEFEQKVDGKWKAVFNSPEAVAALQYIKDLKWKYDVLNSNILTDVSELFKLFGTDQVGMSFGTLDWMNVPVNDYQMSKDNMAMSALPAGPSGNATLMGGNLFMLAPGTTPEQQDAAIKWLEVTGYTSKTDTLDLKGLEENYILHRDSGRIVGPLGLQVWVNRDRVNAEKVVRDKYITVNMDLWQDFIDNGATGMRAEEPVNCQELYKALDVAIQTVVTDINADPQAVMDKLVEDFQRDYLDKAQ